MSPVDDDIRNLIMAEFAKDKKLVERFRKERVRKEIYDTRLKEKQESQKKLQLLSLQEQRKIEKTEKINSSRENEEIMDVPVDRADKRTESSKSAKAVKKKYTPSKKQKLRKINLSNIQSEIGQGVQPKQSKLHKEKKDPVSTSVKTQVKATLAAIGTKKKKKTYKKTKSKENIDVNDEIIVSIKIPEFSSVDELSKILDVSSSDIIAFCLDLGRLATINQRLDWDTIDSINHFDYKAEKIEDISEEIFTSKTQMRIKRSSS